MFISRIFQILLIMLVTTLFGSITYVFAAANSISLTTAGDGGNTVSGYTIMNIDYALNTADPSMLDAVSFTLDADALTAKVKLNTASSNWYSCDNLAGHDWVCHTPSTNVAEIDQLRVAASNR